jgi:hypothetical protein
MRHICIILTASLGLTGCALLTPEPVASVQYGDTSCGAQARQRADDAAVNGYSYVAARVGRDTYDSCMAQQRPVRLSMTP